MANKNTKVFLLTILTALMLFFFIPKKFLPSISQKSSSDKDLVLLKGVADLIKEYYVEEPNALKTMKGAIRGLIGPLDPLSSYLDVPTVKKHQNSNSAELKETGIIVYKKFGTYPVVIGVKENSPAEDAGIKVGDTLSEMDGQPLLELSMREANLYLKDTEEKPVNLKILRTYDSEEMSLQRKSLYDSPFTYIPQKNTSGILKIHSLYPPFSEQFKETILPSLKTKKEALIIDLRNCHEGEIGESLKFINHFLRSDNVGYFQDKNGEKEYLTCPKNPELEGLPIIIWTNNATIGPAEAVAGILMNFQRATTIGLKTPGLLVKQDFYPLEDGSALLLTSQIFYFRDGKGMWLKGITPDNEIKEKNPHYDLYLKKTHEILPKL
ncbi:MAG: PDZ domain-containing protein [Candidatus Aminicenantes bacterium]|nr:MAG: PDZ domain-containing protein [Candidatus Aminicenantes bacterium]